VPSVGRKLTVPSSSEKMVHLHPRRATGVDFAAATVLHDERALTIRDRHTTEDRFVTVGMDATGRVLVVVFTWRGAQPNKAMQRSGCPRSTDC